MAAHSSPYWEDKISSLCFMLMLPDDNLFKWYILEKCWLEFCLWKTLKKRGRVPTMIPKVNKCIHMTYHDDDARHWACFYELLTPTPSKWPCFHRFIGETADVKSHISVYQPMHLHLMATLIPLIHSSPAWGETNQSLNCCEFNFCVCRMSLWAIDQKTASFLVTIINDCLEESPTKNCCGPQRQSIATSIAGQDLHLGKAIHTTFVSVSCVVDCKFQNNMMVLLFQQCKLEIQLSKSYQKHISILCFVSLCYSMKSLCNSMISIQSFFSWKTGQVKHNFWVDCPWFSSRKRNLMPPRKWCTITILESRAVYNAWPLTTRRTPPQPPSPTSPPAPTTTMAAATTWRILQFATTVHIILNCKICFPISVNRILTHHITPQWYFGIWYYILYEWPGMRTLAYSEMFEHIQYFPVSNEDAEAKLNAWLASRWISNQVRNTRRTHSMYAMLCFPQWICTVDHLVKHLGSSKYWRNGIPYVQWDPNACLMQKSSGWEQNCSSPSRRNLLARDHRNPDSKLDSEKMPG